MERIPAEELSDRQLLLAILRRVTQLGVNMSELTDAVAALQVSVAGISERILPQLATLQEALATSQAASAELQVSLDAAVSSDVADDAVFAQTILDQQSALDAANAVAVQAATDIQTQVAALDALAQPAPPVEPPVV